MLIFYLSLLCTVVLAAKPPLSYRIPERYWRGDGAERGDGMGGLKGKSCEKVEKIGKKSAIEELEKEVERRQTVISQSLSDIGVSVNSGQSLSFGLQHLCAPCHITLPLTSYTPSPLSVTSISISDPQFSLQFEGIGRPTLHPGDTITYKIAMIPARTGNITAPVVITTSLGTAVYWIDAQVEDNEYGFRPVSGLGSVWMENRGRRAVEIMGFRIVGGGVEAVEARKHPVLVYERERLRLLDVRVANVTDSGYIAISTNTSDYLIPVTPHQLFPTPPSINFGIVNSPLHRHSVLLTLTNHDSFPVRILRVISDSQRVTASVWNWEVGGRGGRVEVGEIRFCPRTEGVFTGSLRVVTDSGGAEVVIPYKGIALFEFLRGIASQLSFYPSETQSRDVFLALTFPRKLEILSVSPPSSFFFLSDFKPNRLLGKSRLRSAFGLTPIDLSTDTVSFVSVETEGGVVGLPIFIEKPRLECVFVYDFEGCVGSNRVEVHELENGNVFRTAVRVRNVNNRDQTMSARCEGNRYKFDVIANGDAGEPAVLMTQNCTQLASITLPPGGKQTIELFLHISQGPPAATLYFDSDGPPLSFAFSWASLGHIEVTPEALTLEDTYYGRLQKFNIIVKHTYSRPLALQGWGTNVDSLEFDPAVSVIKPNVGTMVGQLVFPRKKGFGKPHPYDFGRSVNDEEIKAWSLYKGNSKPIHLAGELAIHTNATHSISISFAAGAKIPLFASHDSLDFGLQTGSNTAQRYLRISNPSDLALFIQPLLLFDRTTLSKSTVGELLKQSTQARVEEATQAFFLAPEAQRVYIIESRKTIILGPILFRPKYDGFFKAEMLLRNNFTIFETINLTGSRHSSDLRLDKVSLFTPTGYCQSPMLSFHIRNLGTAPELIRDISLPYGVCSYHGVRLLPCHSAALLFPMETIDVGFTVDEYAGPVEIILEMDTEGGGVEFREEIQGWGGGGGGGGGQAWGMLGIWLDRTLSGGNGRDWGRAHSRGGVDGCEET